MSRVVLLVLILSMCLIVQDRQAADQDGSDGGVSAAVPVNREPLAGSALVRQEFLAGLAGAPAQTFPGNIPWSAMRQISVRREQAIEQIIKDDPTVFLQMCLDRYDREVQGYICTLEKHERIANKLKPREIVEAHFREEPFSVFMTWKLGVGKAQRVLFVKGENDDKMLARPAGLLLSHLGIFKRDVDAPDAKAAGRYRMDQFGIKLGTVRTLNAMLSAKGRNALHVKYEGVFRVEKVGDKLCYKIVRTPYDPPEDVEGVNELTIFIDIENWLQVGSILKDAEGKFIAEYYFRDLKLNPQFKANQFSKSAL